MSQEELQNTAVAFSNVDGGVILVGVRDDRTLAGRVLDIGTQDDIHRSMQGEAADMTMFWLEKACEKNFGITSGPFGQIESIPAEGTN